MVELWWAVVGLWWGHAVIRGMDSFLPDMVSCLQGCTAQAK